jgi:hypothetical protein
MVRVLGSGQRAGWSATGPGLVPVDDAFQSIERAGRAGRGGRRWEDRVGSSIIYTVPTWSSL